MAKVGVRYPRYCTYTVTQNEDGTETETYGTGKVAGKAIQIDPSITADAVNQYADDAICESSAPFTGGTLKVEQSDLTIAAQAELCGHTITEDGVLVANADDEAPYVKFGFVYPSMVGGVSKYGVLCYDRVKFAPPSETFKTRGKTLEFQSSTINGTLMENKDGDWKHEKVCDTLTQAMSYLNTWLHMPSSHDALTCTPVPANNATGIAITVSAILTFNNPIDHGNAVLVKTSDDTIIASAKTFNGAKTVLTIDPTASLSNSTEYAIVLTNMTDAYGQTFADTVYKFTTVAA